MNNVNSVVGDIIYSVYRPLRVCHSACPARQGRWSAFPFQDVGRRFDGDFFAKGKAQTAPAGYAPPQTAAPVYTPPVQSPAQVDTPPAQTASAVLFLCGASVSGDSIFCTECGAKTE